MDAAAAAGVVGTGADQEAAALVVAAQAPPLVHALQLHGVKLCVLVRGLTEQYAMALSSPPEDKTARSILDAANPTKQIGIELVELLSSGAATFGDVARISIEEDFGVGLAVCPHAYLTVSGQGQHRAWVGLSDPVQILASAPATVDPTRRKVFRTAADQLELHIFLNGGQLTAAWRAAASLRFDAFCARAASVDPRFSTKLFAQMLGVSAAKVETALGRDEASAAKASCDVVLLRRAEELMEELRDQEYAFLAIELDKVQAKKRGGGAAEAAASVEVDPEFSTPGAEAGGAAAGKPKVKRSRTVLDGTAKSWWAGKLAAEYTGWKQVRAAPMLPACTHTRTPHHAPIPCHGPHTSRTLVGWLGGAEGHREACAGRGMRVWLGGAGGSKAVGRQGGIRPIQ